VGDLETQLSIKTELTKLFRYLSADYERKVFNISACVWDQGAEQNIVMITSKDGGPGQGSDEDQSSSNGLSGGTIAGIVVGAVLGVLLIAAIVAVFILRQRRKWMKEGYSIAAPKTKPDESVLNGPVFNSRSRSTPGDSALPLSSADLSVVGTMSTPEHSRSGANSVPAPVAIGDDGVGNLNSTPELDGADTAIKPSTELDGHEVPAQSDQVVTQHPGVHELPGTEVRAGMHREISTVGALPLFDRTGEGQGRDSQRSLSVSTMGSIGPKDNRPVSDLVSPSSSNRSTDRL